MSNRAIDAVKDFSNTKGSTRLLMFVIADGINKSTGVYEARVKTLVNECNCSERWVQQLIGNAVNAGELIVYERQGSNSGFAIPIYEGELGYDPQPCNSQDHVCLGSHTPLSVDRETVRRDTYQQHRREIKSRRKVKGVNDSAPPIAEEGGGVNYSAPPGELLITPSRTIDHPRVKPSAPITLSATSSFTGDVPGASPQKKQNESRADFDTKVPRTPPVAPTFDEWTARLDRIERHHYEQYPDLGRHSYRQWCRFKGMEPRL